MNFENVKTLTYRIESISPLLMNNIMSMEHKEKHKPARTKDADYERDPEFFKSRMYIDKNDPNKIVIPPHVIKGMLIAAAKGTAIKQKGKRSGYKQLIRSTLFVESGLVLDQTPKDVLQHSVYVKLNGAARIQRIWPSLEKWSGTLSITIADTSTFSEEVLTELLNYGGPFVGFGDYRPEYGRFICKKAA